VIRAVLCMGNELREVSPTEAAQAARDGRGCAWLDFEDVPGAAADPALDILNIHPLVRADMAEEINRPKVDNYGDYLYLVMHSARWDEDRPRTREIDIVLGGQWLITYHEGTPRAIAAARDVLPRRPELLTRGPIHLLHYILDTLVDQYLPIADKVADELDDLEELILEDSTDSASRRILSLKRGMSSLRRIVGPQRDTVLALTRDEFKPIPSDMRPYLRDVYDRMARVSDLLDSFRDEAGSLLELHVAMVSNRLNIIIKRLTVVATIGLPLTLITGWYGMNFALPEYHMRHPVLYILSLSVVAALVTWWMLKRMDLL